MINCILRDGSSLIVMEASIGSEPKWLLTLKTLPVDGVKQGYHESFSVEPSSETVYKSVTDFLASKGIR